MVKAIFFDRDGVLCDLVHRTDDIRTAPWTREEFRLCPRIKDATDLTRGTYKQFVVTNQPDVLDGKLTLDLLHEFHAQLYATCQFDDIVYCLERGSSHYKPNTGMVDDLITKYSVDVSQSFMIGDRWKDIVCGHHAGLYTIFTGAKYNDGGTHIYPDAIVPDVYAACELIMRGVTR